MLKTINLFNEKGHVKASVRNAIKDAAMPILADALATSGKDVLVGKDGAFYVALATTENGDTIYARLETTISIKDPFAPVKEKATKEVEPIVIEL